MSSSCGIPACSVMEPSGLTLAADASSDDSKGSTRGPQVALAYDSDLGSDDLAGRPRGELAELTVCPDESSDSEDGPIRLGSAGGGLGPSRIPKLARRPRGVVSAKRPCLAVDRTMSGPVVKHQAECFTWASDSLQELLKLFGEGLYQKLGRQHWTISHPFQWARDRRRRFGHDSCCFPDDRPFPLERRDRVLL